MSFKVVIEHLEPCLNQWLLTEYKYVADLFRERLIFTNVKKENHRAILSKLGQIISQSVIEYLKDVPEVIVLDPKASEPLKRQDLTNAKYVIIGGIMGDHPPKGRTWKFITSRLRNAIPRNIGPYQFTIAGTAYILKQIERGLELKDIRYVYGLKIEKKLSNEIIIEIELPYAFPLDEHNNVVLPENYIDIVYRYTTIYESRILQTTDNYMDEYC